MSRTRYPPPLIAAMQLCWNQLRVSWKQLPTERRIRFVFDLSRGCVGGNAFVSIHAIYNNVSLTLFLLSHDNILIKFIDNTPTTALLYMYATRNTTSDIIIIFIIVIISVLFDSAWLACHGRDFHTDLC